VYAAHCRRFVNSPTEGFHKITSNESTVSRVKAAENNFACVKISGLLKISVPDRAHVRLTGTGKEVFYLLAKGATPFICGEFFILSASSEPGPLAQKLSAIPDHLKTNLQRYFHSTEQEPKYTQIVPGNTKPMPFASSNRATIEGNLFKLTDLPALSYESLFGW
jgi:hypothetical protein